MQLYRKIEGKRIRYEPYVPAEIDKQEARKNLDDLLKVGALNDNMKPGEIISAVGTLAVMAIHGYREMVPRGSCTDNRIKGVEEATLKMYKDTGAEIDKSITIHVCDVWNKVMLVLLGNTKPAATASNCTQGDAT